MKPDVLTRWLGAARRERVLRVLLSDYVLNGASCAFGMFVVSAIVHLLFGAEAAANATVGVIAALAPDLVGPRRGKLVHLVVAPLIGVPLFLAVQLLRGHPVGLGLFLVPATFLAFLGMAWGKRGAPVAIGVMLVMLFSMSTPLAASPGQALVRTFYCGLGCALYVVYALVAHTVLNARYRTQLTADLLLAVAALLRAHARRVAAPPGSAGDDPTAGLGDLLRRQAALADQLQTTRDVVLEAPRTPRRQMLAGMLIVVLEMRDHLVASELDLERVRQAADHAHALSEIAGIYRDMAADVDRLADALLLHQTPEPAADHQARLAALRLAAADEATTSHAPHDDAAVRAALLRGVAYRARHLNDAVRQLIALARGEATPDLAVVRASWRLFVSPTDWSLQPFLTLWHWRQPALRHAIRAALAVGTGYVIATLLPWGSHDYWVLLTIVVVLRGSLAQTLERRNLRVAGTLLGCVLAVAVLAAQWPAWALLLAMTLAQAIAHSFALRRYLVTAVAVTVLGLVQAHLLNADSSTAFALLERLVDTLIGTGIAWAFAYVLPSWERTQMAALVKRTLAAQAHHARVALGLGQLQAVDNAPELAWRLARREAYDSLSALVLATQRSLAEPRAVRPPLEPLEHLQAHSYQLLAQLSAVKTLLLLRRGRLQPEQVQGPLVQAGERISAILSAPLSGAAPACAPTPTSTSTPESEPLPDWDARDLNVWLLRRLQLATTMAEQLRGDADAVLQALHQGQK